MSPTYRFPRPSVALDVAFFAAREGQLELLLIRRGHCPFAGRWALPGGFLDIGEELEAAARRELREETNLRVGGLEELHTYGKVGRDPRGRTISIVYLALALGDPPEPKSGDDAADARWVNPERLPPMAFDHRTVVRDALRRLNELVTRLDEPFVRLLPRQFDGARLRAFSRAVLGTKGDPVRTLLRRGMIEPVVGRSAAQGKSTRYRVCRLGSGRKATKPRLA